MYHQALADALQWDRYRYPGSMLANAAKAWKFYTVQAVTPVDRE